MTYRSASWLFVAGAFAALTAGCDVSAPEGSVAIRAERLYLDPDRPPLSDAAVVFAEGRIVAAGPWSRTVWKGAKRFRHCDGGVVTAAFQNSHVHFMQPAYAGAAARDAGELEIALTAAFTRFGFTTVVDLASRLSNTVALRRRIDSGEVSGPRILTAGAALYPANGIPIYLRGLPPEILAGMSQPATAGEALTALARNFDEGADAAKLFLVTPQGGGATATMDPEIAMAAVAETHRRGLPVYAHPTDVAGVELAIEAGVDALAHTTIGRGPTSWDAALVEQLVSADIALVPTLMLWRYELERVPELAKFAGGAQEDAVGQLQAFSAAGGKVLFGTDVGYMELEDPTEEYRLMARAMTPMQILASLTTVPAARWGEGDSRGRVEPGMAADLVVLEADPAADAAHFSQVRCTIRGGELIYAAAAAP